MPRKEGVASAHQTNVDAVSGDTVAIDGRSADVEARAGTEARAKRGELARCGRVVAANERVASSQHRRALCL